MCLLFLYLNDDPDQSEYRLIIASNRDEFWNRPTDTAKFRGDNPKWLGGMDLETGRVGGTWLGMSTTGKFGALLNIKAKQEPDKKGRGSLVTDYLCGCRSCETYLASLKDQKSQYNPFQLILLDLREKTGKVHFLENYNVDSDSVAFNPGVYSFDNTNNREKMWKKTIQGQEQFHNLVKEHYKISNQSVLTDQLIELLNDTTQYFPDEQMKEQFLHTGEKTEGEIIKQRSARNVFSPLLQYGTRTNTVIFVDFHGNCDYVERTLETPVATESPHWSTVKYNLQLDLDFGS